MLATLVLFSPALSPERAYESILEAIATQPQTRSSLEEWATKLSALKEKNAALLSVTPTPTPEPPMVVTVAPPMECTGGQIYESCGTPCTRTCDDPSPMCAMTCEKRCQCPNSLPIWTGAECVEQNACTPPSPPPFGLTDPGCAACGCSVQYGNGILRSSTACRVQAIFNRTRYNCQFAVQTGVLYLYGSGWAAADPSTLVDGNVLHTCKEAYPQ